MAPSGLDAQTVSCLHALIVRALECLADRGRHREIHVESLGWNRAGEPLGVDFFDLARFHDPAYGLVDERLELRVVLAQHHAVGFSTQDIGENPIIPWILGVGNLTRDRKSTRLNSS